MAGREILTTPQLSEFQRMPLINKRRMVNRMLWSINEVRTGQHFQQLISCSDRRIRGIIRRVLRKTAHDYSLIILGQLASTYHVDTASIHDGSYLYRLLNNIMTFDAAYRTDAPRFHAVIISWLFTPELITYRILKKTCFALGFIRLVDQEPLDTSVTTRAERIYQYLVDHHRLPPASIQDPVNFTQLAHYLDNTSPFWLMELDLYGDELAGMTPSSQYDYHINKVEIPVIRAYLLQLVVNQQ